MGTDSTGHGTRAVTVPATTAPNSVTPITAPCRLIGWSLVAGNIAPGAVKGNITSPAAGATVVSFGTVPAGEYTLNWQVELSGTLAAAEQDNFEVVIPAVGNKVSVNGIAALLYPQEPVVINVPAGGAVIKITSVGAGTVGAVYAAQATLTQTEGYQATIFDSGQPVGQSAPPPGQSDTQTLVPKGIYISDNVTITVLNGTVSGVVYVTDYQDEDDPYE